MSDHHRTGPLDRHSAERLLDGMYGDARLQDLLSAAAAPAQPGELAGEDAAVAAFNAAPRSARPSRAASLRRFLTVKAVVVVGGSLILGGGAAYAITGQIPGRRPAPSSTPTLHGDSGTSRGGIPVTRGTPSAPLTTPPPSRTRPSSSASPSAGTSEEPRVSVSTPGQPAETATPKNIKTPPRGPGNNNGSPPGENSGNGNGNGNGNGRGNNGNGNGNGNNGSPPGENSGNGNGP